MENSMINPTREMDEALSGPPCPSQECSCPGCQRDRKDAESRENALNFLSEAALALDQAHACLRDLKLHRETPYPSMRVDLRRVFINAFPATEQLRHGLALNIEDLVLSVVALRQELEDLDAE